MKRNLLLIAAAFMLCACEKDLAPILEHSTYCHIDTNAYGEPSWKRLLEFGKPYSNTLTEASICIGTSGTNIYNIPIIWGYSLHKDTILMQCYDSSLGWQYTYAIFKNDSIFYKNRAYHQIDN